MSLAHVLLGLATYIPGMHERLTRGPGGTDSARYCYSVWLRHLCQAHRAGVWNDPTTIAELGPGNSLGMGLAALLTGAEQYFAFDVVEHANDERNLAIFDELVELFTARADIPDETEFPAVKPYLEDYRFPHELLTEERLQRTLHPTRIAKIRAALQATDKTIDTPIRYVVPWAGTSSQVSAPAAHPAGAPKLGSVDMIFSQAVMEHVDDLDTAYAAMRQWLSPNGFISHQVDFKSHGTAEQWNGHWAISNLEWRLMRGRRPSLINRQPCSAHLQLLKKHAFRPLVEARVHMESALRHSNLAKPFKALSDDDLTTSGVYLLAVPEPVGA